MSDARDEGPLANLQDHVSDLLNVRSLDDLSARVRANPRAVRYVDGLAIMKALRAETECLPNV